MNNEPILANLSPSETVTHAMQVTQRGSDELLVSHEWQQKLVQAEANGKSLRIKLGLDPTAPDIHLGHTVVLNKLRQLQELGHTIIFLIGDFTAQIGDPSGRNSTRPPLLPEQIKANAQTYAEQAAKIIDLDKAEVRYNSEWCEALGASGMIRLASHYTVARMLERDDFTKRFQGQVPISIHEFLYPLMQGYDSVALKSDLEIGGTDQKFNLLVGRELQKQYGQAQQCVLTLPLLVGLDGVEKMSKSKNNYVGVTDAPNEMFGKLMSISDDAMWHYYELLSSLSTNEIALLQKSCQAGKNPRDVKVGLAKEMVTRFHGVQAGEDAITAFEARFKEGLMPTDMPEVTIAGAPMQIANVLKQASLCGSTSEANRQIEGGAVRIDGERIEDKGLQLVAGAYILQVGKRRFAKVHLTD